MKKHSLLLFSLLLAGLPLQAQRVLPPPQTQDGFVYFSADEAAADPAGKTINLKGNVTIVQQLPDGQTRTANGQDITLDQLNTTITSVGHMTVQNGDNLLEGDNISVNYQTQDYYAENIQTEYPPLRVISAKEISAQNGTQYLRGAVLTCCDTPDPHYTLTLGKVKMSAQKRVFGTNAVFKLSGVPLLWLPVYWRSLDSQKPWTTYVDFTQSNKTGFAVLTSSVFNEVLGFRPKINLDYYTKSGFGFGGELMAIETETLRGTGEVYYINDRAGTDYDYTVDGQPFQLQNTKRWGLRGGYWWEMYDSSDHFNNPGGALYQFQTQFRMVSDPYFNDSFFRANPYIFTPDQETNFSISRQSRASTLRLSYTQQDLFDWKKGEYMAQKRNMPQLEYTLMPFNFLGLTHHMQANFNNTSLMEETWQRQGSARWTTQKSIRLARNLTLLPSVFYDQHVTLKDDLYNDKTAWIGRLGTDVNLQTETLLGTVDIGYQYTKRLSTNSITADNISPDHGEERNRIYIENYYRPTFNTYVRLASGFNLSNYDGKAGSWAHFKDRVEPILAEAGYNTADGSVNLFVQELYDLVKKNQALIAQTNFFIKNQSLSLGMTNYDTYQDPYSLYRTYSNRYTFTALLGLRLPGTGWGLDLGSDFQLQGGNWASSNKLARLHAQFHDAAIELTVRDRNHNLSFAFRINILCGQSKRREQSQQEAYWYPWRGEQAVRDL